MNMTPATDPTGTSWVLLTLFAIFFLACIRVKSNTKFASAMIRDIFGVRERNNLFDVTARETSFLILVIILSVCSFGVLLYTGVTLYRPLFTQSLPLPGLPIHFEGIFAPVAICMGITTLYVCVMWMCYFLVGHVFSDATHTKMWLRGYTSSIAFGGLFFFPLALLDLSYPQYTSEITLIGLIVLILVKFLFIVKGFRIFFTESSSWVVFLYYLCSLEIIPLTITFGVACSLLG